MRSAAAIWFRINARSGDLDALELRAFCADFKGIPWSEIVEIAAGRVLDCLHRQWRPVDGRIYGFLSSDTRRRWVAASDEERKQIQAAFARLKPTPFETSMVAGATPSWLVTGITPDIPAVHTHRMLFSIGADADFLQGDRLMAWAMDLATAGLAAHALARTDRYRQFGLKVTKEQLTLAAVNGLLLTAPENAEEEHRG